VALHGLHETVQVDLGQQDQGIAGQAQGAHPKDLSQDVKEGGALEDHVLPSRYRK